MGWFNFLRTPDNRNTGTEIVSVAMNQTLPWQNIYNKRRYNVQRSMAAPKPGFFKADQLVPVVPIEGNGSFLQGQLALQSLVDLQRAKDAKK